MSGAPGFTILVQGQELPLVSTNRENLLQAVYLSGLVEPPPLCAGLGRCGRCRVRFITQPPPAAEKEKEILGDSLTEQGWRLSCLHRPVPDARIQLPDEVRLLSLHNGEAKVPTRSPAAGVPLAVDFGSTSLHFSVVLPHAPATSPQIIVNPQMGAGPDVISRIAYALKGGQAELAALSHAALRRMVEDADGPVKEICLAANSAMALLLLDKNPQGLAASPYSLDYRGGQTEELPGLPPLWLAPLIGPFIGGDVSAGYAALAFDAEKPAEYPFILADMGTNGEFVLALDAHNALAASLPLGPALEGIGMRCGAEARGAVVTGFDLSPSGLLPRLLEESGGKEPAGISGTGYLSLLSQLLQNGLLQKDGLLRPVPHAGTPLAQRLSKGLGRLPSGESFWAVPPEGKLLLTASDIEELLKIKAAFSLALKLLLKEAGLSFGGVKRLYLSGALGSHVRLGDLEQLGFIPPGAAGKTVAAGNTALAGAALLAQKTNLRPALVEWAAKVKTLALTGQQDFQDKFAKEMVFEF